MKFKELSVYLDKLEKTSSRIEITKILADLFKKSATSEIDKIVYLLLGRLGPKYKSIVFNLAEKMMLVAIADAYKKEIKEVKSLYQKEGDLGKVCQILAKGKGKELSVLEVFDRFVGIAKDEGEGSQERKIKETARLLFELDPLSARFVARIPVGRLRLGFSDKTVLDALSWMRRGDKSAKAKLEKVYQVIPDVGALALRVKEVGIKKGIKGVKAKVGVPILPMLAQRLKSPREMIEKMGMVSVEPKLDGLRLLIHFKAGKDGFIKAFTRNLNENAWMFPELKNIGKYVKASEVILDTEVVGVDEKRKSVANFQVTMTRRRKHAIEETASKVPVRFFVFDILFKNGKSLMDELYIRRRDVLKDTVKSGKLFDVVEYKLTKDPKEISRLNARYTKEGLEGIMVKRADSRYVPGRTGWRWVKMKEAEGALAKLADTIDAVVMGYTTGKGRRSTFGIGQFLAGVRDKGKIKTITKVGTGLTDEQFRELKKRLAKLEVKERPKEYEVHKTLEPDFWVRPSLVVELAADEITKSPNHASGLALRFPRLVKLREDKSPAQSTTLSEVKKLFKLQKTNSK